MTPTRPQVLLTRPEPAARRSADRVRRLGVDPVSGPVLEVVPRSGSIVSTRGAQAVIATSANALRHGTQRLSATDLPLLAIGEATAAEARARGFQLVQNAGGDAHDLAELVRTACAPASGRLIYLAGQERARDMAALLEPSGYQLETVVVYATRTADRLPRPARAALRAGAIDAVLLYSPRSAAAFAALARADNLDDALAGLVAVCISGRTAAAIAGGDWRDVVVAKRPDEAHLLEALARALGLQGVNQGGAA